MPTIDDPPPHEVLRTLHRPLRVPLTDDEHRAKGQALAAQHEAVVLLEQQHKAAKAEMRDAESDAKAVLAALAWDVRTQSETRSIECEEIADYSKGTVDVVRLDTGAVVDTRPLSDAERQRTIVPDPTPEDGLPELPGAEASRKRNRKPAEA